MLSLSNEEHWENPNISNCFKKRYQLYHKDHMELWLYKDNFSRISIRAPKWTGTAAKCVPWLLGGEGDTSTAHRKDSLKVLPRLFQLPARSVRPGELQPATFQLFPSSTWVTRLGFLLGWCLLLIFWGIRVVSLAWRKSRGIPVCNCPDFPCSVTSLAQM